MTGHAYDYDHIVIGSGFGGSVAALRLAEKGYRVGVLEAGRRWRAEDLPRSTWDLRRYLWEPSLRLFGLMRMEVVRHVMMLGGVGVGGGSLVYGNTLFVPLDSFFECPEIARLGGAEGLMPFYERAQTMMGVVPNPRLFEPDEMLRQTAAEYGREETFAPSPVGIFFGDPDTETPDPYFDGKGPARSGCRFCGGCFLGCQHNAKNSLDKNYLYLADGLGVEIHAETQVTRITPLSEDGSDGYRIETQRSTAWFGGERRVFRARGIVISAGVVGTLELLLQARDRSDLPRLSSRIGECVRTNSESIVGVRARDRAADTSVGIAASSSVWVDEHTQIQADRYPAGSDSMAMLSTVLVDGGGRIPRFLRFLWQVVRHPIDFLRVAWPFGFARQSVILIVMQDHDNSLQIVRTRRWRPPFTVGLQSRAPAGKVAPPYIPIGNDFARKMAARMNAVPLSSVPEVLVNTPVSAHILGGGAVAESAEEGVIDSAQRVFGYENLRICDGTVIPANLGVNPALSILAFSERAMSLVPAKDPQDYQS